MFLVTSRNPRVNSLINPLVNGNINPLINGNINPLINGNINPLINGNINPLINGNINPLINGNINPNINPNFSGLYLFDRNLNPIEFIIKVNETFIQVFDFSMKNTCYGVAHSINGFVLFNGSSFIGHLESDSRQGYNKFDTYNKWVGFVK
ncbi:MAG TPA: hypothetical protein VNX01_02920 [Bacteroidia bacterium]|nr:hypothetical protein [Bacteroidia bacterium]